jgi:predicted peptidase
MLTKTKKALLVIFLLAVVTSCESGNDASSSGNSGPVVSDDSVSPQFEILKDGDTEDPNYTNWYCKPRDYDNPANAAVKYPLVIYLHGSSQASLTTQCFYFGWEGNAWCDDTAIAYKKNYPCFVYQPLATVTNSWNVTTLKKWIDLIIANNRVDTARIYVNGFSMGGYAAISLANAYATAAPPVYCAAIVVLAAGPGFSSINDTLKSKSSFWFIHGETASEAASVDALYDGMKAYAANTGGSESTSSYQVYYKVPGQNQKDVTRTSYTRNGKTFLQKMVILQTGHVISSYPYYDPDTIKWIFDQRLDSRP